MDDIHVFYRLQSPTIPTIVGVIALIAYSYIFSLGSGHYLRVGGVVHIRNSHTLKFCSPLNLLALKFMPPYLYRAHP